MYDIISHSQSPVNLY